MVVGHPSWAEHFRATYERIIGQRWKNQRKNEFKEAAKQQDGTYSSICFWQLETKTLGSSNSWKEGKKKQIQNHGDKTHWQWNQVGLERSWHGRRYQQGTQGNLASRQTYSDKSNGRLWLPLSKSPRSCREYHTLDREHSSLSQILEPKVCSRSHSTESSRPERDTANYASLPILWGCCQSRRCHKHS